MHDVDDGDDDDDDNYDEGKEEEEDDNTDDDTDGEDDDEEKERRRRKKMEMFMMARIRIMKLTVMSTINPFYFLSMLQILTPVVRVRVKMPFKVNRIQPDPRAVALKKYLTLPDVLFSDCMMKCRPECFTTRWPDRQVQHQARPGDAGTYLHLHHQFQHPWHSLRIAGPHSIQIFLKMILSAHKRYF